MALIELTRDVEARRMSASRNEKTTWEYYSGPSLVTAVRTARDMGWKEMKVQVRRVKNPDNTEMYYVEPFEDGCGCRGILKYKDYFD